MFFRWWFGRKCIYMAELKLFYMDIFVSLHKETYSKEYANSIIKMCLGHPWLGCDIRISTSKHVSQAKTAVSALEYGRGREVVLSDVGSAKPLCQYSLRHAFFY